MMNKQILYTANSLCMLVVSVSGHGAQVAEAKVTLDTACSCSTLIAVLGQRTP